MPHFDLSTVLTVITFIILLLLMLKGRVLNQRTFKQILAWLIILSVLVLGYAFRFELSQIKERFLAVLIPNYNWSNQQGELVISRNYDGHFYLDAYVNDVKIRFLVDTGASTIHLTQSDAKRLGFDVKELKYTRTSSTANGLAKSAPVRLKTIQIADKLFYNQEASVSQNDNDVSLLGMSLIYHFKDFKITRDTLILNY